MFTLEAPKSYNIRRQLVHMYQEQQDDLDVVFKCSDGQQRCSRLVLNLVSQFYTEQLEGRDRLGNKAEFNYAFSIECIKAFLDYMHGITVEELSLATLMEMIKFIKFEGKDTSDFENGLLDHLSEKLERAELPIFTKLAICVVYKSFDNYKPQFDKLCGQFFVGFSNEELKLSLFDLNITTKDNQRLTKMMSDTFTDVDMENAIFQMIKTWPRSDKRGTKVFKSEMTKEMEEYAIDSAERAKSRCGKDADLTPFITNDFYQQYGGRWHCIQGSKRYQIHNADGKYIDFDLDTVGQIVLFSADSDDDDEEEDSLSFGNHWGRRTGE